MTLQARTSLPSSKPAVVIWQANTVNKSHKARGRKQRNVRPTKGRTLNCWECSGRAWWPFGLRSKQCSDGSKGLQFPPASVASEVQFWRAPSVGKPADLAQSHRVTAWRGHLNSLTQCSSLPHPTAQNVPILLCPQLVPMTFLKNAYLSHSIRCHMQTVRKVTYNLGHRPAHELVQQCFLLSVVYSHNLNSKMKESYFYHHALHGFCIQGNFLQILLFKTVTFI